tara:strand:- start:221 stop:1480 length:1260 start_codon:yes stop_codon:yes gene_type:complete
MCYYVYVRRLGQYTQCSFIKNWLDDPDIILYDQLAFLPNVDKCPAYIYNLWRGFAAERHGFAELPEDWKPEEDEDVQVYLQLCAELTNEHQPSIDYIINWSAQLIQNPDILPRTLLLFKGMGGVGKTFWAELLMNIVGKGDYSFQTGNPERDLFGQFNKSMAGKLLVVVNETRAKAGYDIEDILKTYVTEDTFALREMRQDTKTCTNYTRFIFCSNNDFCLKVDVDDRRKNAFEPSTKRKGDTAYWKKIGNLFHKPEFQYKVYTFLRRRDIAGVDLENDRPKTALYNQLREYNMSLEIRWLRGLLEDAETEKTSVLKLWNNDRDDGKDNLPGSKGLVAKFKEFLKEYGAPEKYQSNQSRLRTELQKVDGVDGTLKDGRYGRGLKVTVAMAMQWYRDNKLWENDNELPMFIEDAEEDTEL